MITNKQLRETGFVFVGRRYAWLQTETCKLVLIGGILTVMGKPNKIYLMEELARWRLRMLIAECQPKAAAPAVERGTFTDENGVVHWYVNIGSAKLLLAIHTDAIAVINAIY